MKKEELMKLEGMTEELATKIAEQSAEELKGMIPKTRLDEVIAERDNAKKDHADVLKHDFAACSSVSTIAARPCVRCSLRTCPARSNAFQHRQCGASSSRSHARGR